jgi:dCTP deaminase
MSTIVDSQIEAMALSQPALIKPFRFDQVNPASYDVRLAGKILIESEDGQWIQQSLPYILSPGEFILGVTEEYFNVPNYMEAVFQLKSSRGREGYEHVLSGYIDPGYSGEITLELVNVNRYRALPLVKDMLIGQVRFMKTDQPCRVSYATKGHYQGDRGVKPSKVSVFGVCNENP